MKTSEKISFIIGFVGAVGCYITGVVTGMNYQRDKDIKAIQNGEIDFAFKKRSESPEFHKIED